MRSIEISVAALAATLVFGAAGSAQAQSRTNSNTMHHGSMNSQPATTGMDRSTTGSTMRGASQYAPGQSAMPANRVAPGRSNNLPPGQRMQQMQNR